MKKVFLSFAVIIVYAGYFLFSPHKPSPSLSTPQTSFAPPAPQPSLSNSGTPPSTGQSAPPSSPAAQNNSAAQTSGSAQQQPAQTPPAQQANSSLYKDGTYVGSSADAFYGMVQVEATISGGKITNVTFLQHPSGRAYSDYVNSIAVPQLSAEAVQAQSAQVDGVSGATETSMAFVQSLSSALAQAQY